MDEQIDIEKLSLVELKALVFDESRKVEQSQVNIKILMSKIEEKQKEPKDK